MSQIGQAQGLMGGQYAVPVSDVKQIPREVLALEKAVSQLESLMELLENRLSGVMRGTPPVATGQPKEIDNFVGLATGLHGVSVRIFEANNKLDSILSRLEL